MPALPRHYMLRDISQYLTDTHGMSPLEAFAFNNLEIAYWLMGYLPNDPERLAFIAQIPLSMLGARVLHAFSLGIDGHLHNVKAQKLRDDERSKALKRQEHARRAAMCRWHPEEKNQGGEIPAKDVHARASIEHETMLHLPLTGSPSRALPLLDPLITKSTNLRAREAPAINPTPAASQPAWSMAVDGQHRSVIKAKPQKSGIRARREAGEDGKAHPGVVRVSTVGALRRKQASSKPSKGKIEAPGTGTRFERFRREIFKLWELVNEGGPQCTWQEQDKNALASILGEHPDLTVEQFRQCLGNVQESMREGELSPTVAPRCWLVRVVEYLSCPLDRFNRPIYKPPRLKTPPRQF